MRRGLEALSKLIGKNFGVTDDGNGVFLTPNGEIRDMDNKLVMPADEGRANLFRENKAIEEGAGEGNGGGGLPTGGEPFKQLVTDDKGRTVWDDRLAYQSLDEAPLFDGVVQFDEIEEGLFGRELDVLIEAGTRYEVYFDGKKYILDSWQVDYVQEQAFVGDPWFIYMETSSPELPFCITSGYIMSTVGGGKSLAIRKFKVTPVEPKYMPVPFGKLLVGDESEVVYEWDGDPTGRDLQRFNAMDYYRIGETVPFSNWGEYVVMRDSGESSWSPFSGGVFYGNENDTVREQDGVLVAHETGSFTLYDSITGENFNTVTINKTGTYFIKAHFFVAGLYKETGNKCLEGIEINGGTFNSKKFVLRINSNGELTINQSGER